ncbi:MAG: prepilin-type N-terminal cleavage/methylation domain-containing protein [Myxococcota bacterium]
MDRRGFTLIELLVVLAIVAGIAGLGAYTVGMLDQGALKSEALKITSSIKYSFSQAAVNNSRYRIVFDLDSGSYAAEVVESANVEQPTNQPGADEEFLTEEAQALAEQAEREDDLFDDDEDNPFGINRRVSYQRVQDGVIDPGQLKDGMRFTRVVVGQAVDVTSGQASINFFPNGFQEPAIVYMEDAQGRTFSIQTEPLTGRVFLYNKEIEIPSDFGQGEVDD